MSGHSSARSSLEEPFWEERGCSALSKNNPVAGPKITKLLWSSAGLEAGPRQLLLAAPRVCCAAGAAGGGPGSSPLWPGGEYRIQDGSGRWGCSAWKWGRKGRVCSWESLLGKRVGYGCWEGRHNPVVSTRSRTGVWICCMSAECQHHLLLQSLLNMSPKASLLPPRADPAPVLGFPCRGSGKCHIPGGPTRWDLLAR